MEKIVKNLLTILILFFVGANATTLDDSINKDISLISSANKDKTVKIFHDIKNLYIKAIMDDDKNAQILAIRGLIKCSKILHLKYNYYEYELSSLLKEGDKNRQIKKTYSVKNIIPKLKAMSAYNDRLIITFDRAIDKKDISFFELNSKSRYRDIFDIKAKLSFKPKKIFIKNIEEIRISQFAKNSIRIVLQNKKPINSIFSIEKNKIIIKVDIPHEVKKNINYKKTYFTSKITTDKIIIIDPGHGGKDTGAIGYKRLREKNAVLKIALKLGKYLRRYGYKVYYTRKSDRFIKLRNRTHFANLKKADIFISIHANAAPKRSQYLSAKGVETYFLSPARSTRAKRVSAKENSADISSMDYYSKQVFLNFLNREKIVASNKLAIDIQRGILKNVKKRYRVVDGGVRKAPFWVLVGAQMPAVLIETGYITNPTEAKRLFNPYYEDLLAKGIANGVVSYFEKNR